MLKERPKITWAFEDCQLCTVESRRGFKNASSGARASNQGLSRMQAFLGDATSSRLPIFASPSLKKVTVPQVLSPPWRHSELPDRDDPGI